MFAAEMKKLITARFLIVIVVGLVMNVLLLNYNVQKEYSNGTGGTYISFYKDIFSDMEGMPDDKKVEYLNHRYEEFASDESWESEEKAEIVSELAQQAEKIAGYENYISQVVEEAGVKSEISVFAKKGTFSYRNVKKQATDFEQMHETNVKFDISEGVIVSVENTASEFLVILIILFVCGMAVISENSNGMMSVIKSTKKGRTHTILCKIEIMAVLSILLSVAFMIENLIYAEVTFGLGDLNRALQSVDGYIASTLHLSVFGYLICLCVVKALGYFIVGILGMLVCQMMKQPAMAYVIMAFVILANFLLYEFILPVSTWNVFRYVNLRNFISGVDLFKAELNINIFGFPVEIYIVSIVAIFIFMAILSALNIYVFSLKDFVGIKINIKKIYAKKSFSNRILGYEFFKVLITQKVLWILILFVAARFYIQDTERVLDLQQVYERSYMEELSGKLTDRQDQYITDQKKAGEEIKNKIEKYDTDYSEGNLTRDEWEEISNVLYQKLVPYTALEMKILPVYEHLKEKQAKGEEAYFIYQEGYNRLFSVGGNSNGTDVSRSAFLLLFLIICFSGIYNMEYETGMADLIITCKNGRRKTVNGKINTSIIIATLMMMITYLPDLWFVADKFGLDYAWTSLNNLYEFADWGTGWKIWQYILLLYGIRLITVWSITLVIQMISSKTKENTVAIFVSCVVLFMPIMMHMLKVEVLDYVSFLPLLEANGMIQKGFGVTAIYLVVAVTLGVLSVIFLQKVKKYEIR